MPEPSALGPTRRRLFSGLNASVVPVWAAMMLLPRSRLTRRLVRRAVPVHAGLSVAYTGLLGSGMVRNRAALDFRDPDVLRQQTRAGRRLPGRLVALPDLRPARRAVDLAGRARPRPDRAVGPAADLRGRPARARRLPRAAAARMTMSLHLVEHRVRDLPAVWRTRRRAVAEIERTPGVARAHLGMDVALTARTGGTPRARRTALLVAWQDRASRDAHLSGGAWPAPYVDGARESWTLALDAARVVRGDWHGWRPATEGGARLTADEPVVSLTLARAPLRTVPAFFRGNREVCRALDDNEAESLPAGLRRRLAGLRDDHAVALPGGDGAVRLPRPGARAGAPPVRGGGGPAGPLLRALPAGRVVRHLARR
ncbi:DUF4281 domain-containing protein [Nocardioides sp. W3-2-3]|uniref:abscisic acid-deficient protein Aba4 family protein n=1 Tax=Nocardioides convexus TaxID=2712224 RepID=UPI0024188B79|nr:abscisic acid-deficient protein Aba4 family protein [Nocardioides convexus]NGZ99470.1 DUF4281 domain-containing protein [Nocardioides convexus]